MPKLRHIFAALVAPFVEAMLRKALIRAGKTPQTAGTLCAICLNFAKTHQKRPKIL
jgi:hypothetical protein